MAKLIVNTGATRLEVDIDEERELSRWRERRRSGVDGLSSVWRHIGSWRWRK